MARKDRKPAVDGRLERLLSRGEWRPARAEARRLAAAPGASEAERELARRALERTAPERTASWAALAGLLLFALAAFLGLVPRR